MAEFTKLAVTEAGREMLAESAVSAGKIEFTKVCTSDRAYREDDINSLTGLEGIRQTNNISSIRLLKNGRLGIEAAFENRGLSSAYFVRAVGLYARTGSNNEVLYAVAIEKTGRYSMPAYNNITVNSIYLKLFLAVENAENIRLEVSPGAFITVSEIGRIKEELNAENAKFKSEVSAKQEELNQALTKAIKDIADSKGASTTTFNPDKTITTVNSLETVTTTINKKERSITSKHVYKNGLTKTLKTVFKDKQIITTEVE